MRSLLPGLAALALAVFALPPAARAAYQGLEEIPVESRTVRDVEDVAASYGLGTAFHSTRPWTRSDLAAFLQEIVALAPDAEGDPAVARLRRELGPEAGGWPPLVRAQDDQGSLEVSPYLRADFAEDRALRTVVRDFRGGVQASALLGRGLLLFTDVYAGTRSPGPHGNPVESRHFGLIEGVEFNPYFDRAYLRARGPLGTVTLGHSWLRWGTGGDGRRGALRRLAGVRLRRAPRPAPATAPARVVRRVARPGGGRPTSPGTGSSSARSRAWTWRSRSSRASTAPRTRRSTCCR